MSWGHSNNTQALAVPHDGGPDMCHTPFVMSSHWFSVGLLPPGPRHPSGALPCPESFTVIGRHCTEGLPEWGLAVLPGSLPSGTNTASKGHLKNSP